MADTDTDKAVKPPQYVPPSPGDRSNLEELSRLYAQAKTIRSPLEPDWRMAAAYCRPQQYNAWMTEGNVADMNNQTVKRFAYDNTGMKSLPKYTAILNAIHTPLGQRWHKLRASDTQLMKLHEVRTYFDDLNAQLFRMRYNGKARFIQAQSEMYTGLGLYGTGPKSITWGTGMDGTPSFKYKGWPLRDVFILVSDDGEVTHVFRRFFINARQYRLKWPEGKAPRCIELELAKTGGPDEAAMKEFVQVLHYRRNYDPDKKLSLRRFRVVCDYICVVDKEYAGEEEAYSSMPMLTPRVATEAGSPYGYSAAMIALPALGGVSQIKKTVIKQGHKALDPAYITNDDGNLSSRLDIRPGRVNPGGVNAQGQKLVHALETGNFQVAEQLLSDERADIEDPFFVKLFTILFERPEITAAQVVDELGQKAALVAPTLGRLQHEDGEPTIMREIELLTEHGLRPDMPPALVEAGGQYDILFTSPMAKSLFAEDVSGFMRWVEFSLNYAQTSGDRKPLTRINMDDAQPEVADYMSVPARWINSDKRAKELWDEMQKEQQKQQIVDQAPAIASVVNTAAKTKGTSNARGVPN